MKLKTILSAISSFILSIILMPNAYPAVIVKDKIWKGVTVLNVVFVDGSVQQKAWVQKYAPLWLEESYLKFEFFQNFNEAPKETHIRVSFKSHTGSQLGDHQDYLSHDPTLLLNELTYTGIAEVLVKRYVLHEFGHALGFEHEYRNPKWPYGEIPIQSQIDKCVPRMNALRIPLDEAKKRCRETNSRLDQQQVFSTIYDEHSIMNYPQEIVLESGKTKSISAKTRLSALDKLAIRKWYGKKDSFF